MKLKSIITMFLCISALLFVVNIKNVNAQELVQPSIGATATINAGTDRIIDVIDKASEAKEKNLPELNIKNEPNSESNVNADNNMINQSDQSTAAIDEDVEIFYPPSEARHIDFNSYLNKKSNSQQHNNDNSNLNTNDITLNDENEINRASSKSMTPKKSRTPKPPVKVFTSVSSGILKSDTSNNGEIKNKISGVDIGFVRELNTSSGKLLIGGLIDYGHNDYDNEFRNIKGSGKSEVLTFGAFVRQNRDDNVYYEGSIRIGRAKTNFHSNDFVLNNEKLNVNYEESTPVYAGHAKLGKKIYFNNSKRYADIYGLYAFSHQDPVNMELSTNENYRFGSIYSNRLRIGCRMTNKVVNGKIYYGLAYQYETNGKIKAKYNGEEVQFASCKGSSGILELGYIITPRKTSNINIDLSTTGFVGKQRGFMVQANLITFI